METKQPEYEVRTGGPVRSLQLHNIVIVWIRFHVK